MLSIHIAFTFEHLHLFFLQHSFTVFEKLLEQLKITGDQTKSRRCLSWPCLTISGSVVPKWDQAGPTVGGNLNVAGESFWVFLGEVPE